MRALFSLFVFLLFLAAIALLVAAILWCGQGWWWGKRGRGCCYNRCCGCKWCQQNLLSDVGDLAKTTDADVVTVAAVVSEPCCWGNESSSSSSSSSDGCCPPSFGCGPCACCPSSSSSSSSSSCKADCTKPKFWAVAQGTDQILRYAYNPECCATCKLQAVAAPALPTSLTVNKCCAGFALTSTPDTGIGAVTGAAQLIGATANGVVFGFNNEVSPTGTFETISNTGAIYSGVALSCGCQLYVANFASGLIEVYDNAWAPVTTFTDPALTAIGYAPSNIAIIDGFLYVLFAQQNGSLDAAVPGIGNGFVDVFCTDGSLVRRLINRGPLNLPISIAKVGSELYIANQGDGVINRFDQCTGQFLGPVTDCCKNTITIDGLTSLAVVPVCAKDACGRCIEGCPPPLCRHKLFVGAAPVQGANGLVATLAGLGPH